MCLSIHIEYFFLVSQVRCGAAVGVCPEMSPGWAVGVCPETSPGWAVGVCPETRPG